MSSTGVTMGLYKSIFIFSLLPFSLSLWGTSFVWTPATNSWESNGNWTPNTGFPNAPTDSATFNNAGGGQSVVVSEYTPVGQITFNSTGGGTYNITNSSHFYLLLGGGGFTDNIIFSSATPNTDSHTISCPLSLAGLMQINFQSGATGTLTLSGEISSETYGVNLTGAGAGTVIFSAAHTYKGETNVLTGTIKAGGSGVFSPSSDVTLASTGTINLNGTSNTLPKLSGAGSVTGGGILTISNGGDFSGVISSGALVVTGGTFTLSGTNTYSGGTTISAGTLALSGSGSLSSAGDVIADGTFDISGATSPLTINNLGGGGTVALGNNSLTLTTSGITSFSGTIEGTGGALSIQGNGAITLSGTSTYTGATTIGASATLTAGSTTALSPSSDYTVTGILDLNNFANTINSLTNLSISSAVITGGTSGILTIANGGSFLGAFSGTGGITLTGGTFSLGTTANNTYKGLTTVTNDATLQAGAANAFASGATSAGVNLLDSSTLDLLTHSNTISTLSGDPDASVLIGSGATLTITGGSTSATFAGSIQGAGALTYNKTGTTWTLSGDNSYSGGTLITTGTLALTDGGNLSATGTLVDNGTFDITGITSSTAIGNLGGSGSILLGSKSLAINTSFSSTFSGAISGTGGSLTVQGTSAAILSGASNTYTGSTTVASGATLQAGIAAAFAPLSDFTVTGILQLATFNNTLKSLSGSGSVTGTGGALTISNGGDFSGVISGTGTLTLLGGTLTLSGVNTYSGAAGTTITAGTLALSGSGSLPSTKPLVDNGIFDISAITSSTTIGNLTGSGTIALGSKTLAITTSTPSTFSGSIGGTGGALTVQGTSTLTLSGISTNTGATTVGASATLQAGSTTAFSPSSAYTVTGTLALANNANTIGSLLGAGAVTTGGTSGILTIANGGTFSGGITGTGGVTLTGGTLTLSTASAANTYSGFTTVSNDAILKAGATDPFSHSSAVDLLDSATLDLSLFSGTIPTLSGDPGTSVNFGSGGHTLTVTGGTTSTLFAGTIQGAGALVFSETATVWALTGLNTFSGGTTITAGTLELLGSGSLLASGALANNATFDIAGITSSTAIGNLTGSGSGAILMGSKALTVNVSAPSTYSGSIAGTGGLLTVDGSSTLTLSGTSSYTGPTTVGSGATLKVGVGGILAPFSNFTVTGTLDLNDVNTTINSLSGSGAVKTGAVTGAALTLSNGGNFSGVISQLGSLALQGGTLTLSGANTYSGATSIATSTTLNAGATNTLSANSAVTVSGTLALNNFANAIKSLSGAGSVTTGGLAGILSVSNGGSFSGGITGLGGLTLTGGTLTLSTPISANTYTGATTISNATLLAGGVNVYPATSPFTLGSAGILDLAGNNNTIYSLASTFSNSSVTLGSATLTVSGGATTSFAGQVTNSPCGGLSITGGTNLTLTNTTNDYCGPTSITNGSLTTSTVGSLSSLTDVTVSTLGTFNQTATSNAANSLTNSGNVVDNGLLSLATTYTQTSGGTLTLQNSTTVNGQIFTVGDINLAGNLVVQVQGTAYTTSYPLLKSTSGALHNQFTNATFNGFGVTQLRLVYYTNEVDLVFLTCSSTWTQSALGTLNQAWGIGGNWTPGCVPGSSGNQNDAATFANNGMATYQVNLANSTGTAPLPITLFQLIFDAPTTQYTISQYSTASTITFDETPSGTPQLLVQQGSHFINAPIILNQNTEMRLTDGAQLTFLPLTTLTSLSTQSFTIDQSGSSTLGSGLLVNSTLLAPYSMNILSASVQNTSQIAPINSLTIGALSGQNATVTNSATNASIGTTAAGSTMVIGGAGNTVVNNSGAGATFGSSAINANMTIGSTGTTTITNNGAGAFFGPSGTNGSLTIQGANTTLTNSGLGAYVGASGNGGNVYLNDGVVYNSSGARFSAGRNGSIIISGGTLHNDVKSTVGSAEQNLTLTGGTLNTSGNVEAFDYTQGNASTLQVNLTALPTIFGNVAATGTASVNGTLVVNALPSSISLGQTVDLIYADRGLMGTYSTVDFTNFPAGVVPHIIYTPNAVELTFTSSPIPPTPPPPPPIPIVIPTTGGGGAAGGSSSFSGMTFLSTGQFNFMVLREMHDLHNRMFEKKKKGTNKKNVEQFASNYLPQENLVAVAEPVHYLLAQPNIPLQEHYLTAQSNTSRQEHYLAERVAEAKERPTKIYFGPFDSFGHFDKMSSAQPGFEFNSIGILAGIDHAFETVGAGFVANYANTTADVNHHAGNFHIDQAHASGYATWVPKSCREFALDAIVGWSYQWYTTHRKTTRTAKGNTQGMESDALLGAEYIFANTRFQSIPENLLVTPFANLQYIWVDIDGYSEHDAGIYDLKVRDQHASSLRSSIGTRLEYIVKGKNVTFKPEFDIAWQYEYLDDKRHLHLSSINLAQTQTASLGILGAGRNTLLLGVDLLLTIYDVFELETSYDLQWNQKYINNTFYLGFGVLY